MAKQFRRRAEKFYLRALAKFTLFHAPSKLQKLYTRSCALRIRVEGTAKALTEAKLRRRLPGSQLADTNNTPSHLFVPKIHQAQPYLYLVLEVLLAFPNHGFRHTVRAQRANKKNVQLALLAYTCFALFSMMKPTLLELELN